MSVTGMKMRARSLGPLVAMTLAGLSLTGCVVYPHSGYAYGPAYYEPAYVAPPPVVVVGGGWGWGWGHHWR